MKALNIKEEISMKKILLIDIDGVLAKFDMAFQRVAPGIFDEGRHAGYKAHSDAIYNVCTKNPNIFRNLDVTDGAVEMVTKLAQDFEIYFVSSPLWSFPKSMADKQYWLEKHFGELARKRLVLTHNKALLNGDYLVDDRLSNGVENFAGEHIYFGTEKFPDWNAVYEYLNKI